MQKAIILILSACFFLSCSKKNEQHKIVGKWELESFIGFPGNQSYAPGNGNILEFRKSGDFERIESNGHKTSGTYRFEKRSDCLGFGIHDFLIFTTSGNEGDFRYSIENSKLFLETSNCLADGGTSSWVKLP